MTPRRSEAFARARLRRADRHDARLRELLAAAAPDRTGLALVAVGGYGRRELSPQSDLDVVLLHDPARGDVGEVAARVWYPLWDAGVRLDHAVRTLDGMQHAADADLRALLGMLDARHVAGDGDLTLQLRARLLARWRRDARSRLPDLAAECRSRAERSGDLAYAAVPDLKDSRGGLRDGVVLRALVASWLVDVPHAELERCLRDLLAVRDGLHRVSGRPGDRLPPEVVPDLAVLLGERDATALQRRVRALGRRMAHLSTLTWHRVDWHRVDWHRDDGHRDDGHRVGVALGARPRRTAVRRPELQPLAAGVARSSGEVVLDARARPEHDPWLLLRAAAVGAERGLMLAPASAARLARSAAAPSVPWPRAARDLMVRLLAAGDGLVPVWETLEEVDALGTLLPEWEGVRLLPSESPVHRFTVDRHSVETCVQAARLAPCVDRPDLLLTAALLHDLGKAHAGDHSRAGAVVARTIARRWGFAPADADVVARLVRHHLLLSHTATRRDLDDPATVALVARRAGGTTFLDLLAALTEADARATGPAAWSAWRRGLVHDLVARTRARLIDAPLPPPVETWPGAGRDDVGRAVVDARDGEDGSVLLVGAPDRLGLLAEVSAAVALSGLHVRSARAGVSAGVGWSRWHLEEQYADPARVRQRLLAVFDRRAPLDRLRRPADRAPAQVRLRPADSARATVLEVRDRDWSGLLHAVCAALADVGVQVLSAHVETLGPQAVDVFYTAEAGGGPLSAVRAWEAVQAVGRAGGWAAADTLGPDRHRQRVQPPSVDR